MTEPIALHYELDGPAGRARSSSSAAPSAPASAMWAPQVPALSRRFRVLRYDHRGHGRSPAPPGPYELADLGRDVLALLDRLDLDRVAYGGLSLGGMVGMWLGVHAPERISSLVLCCTSPYLGPPDRWLERIELVRTKGTGALVDAMTARYFSAADPRRRRPPWSTSSGRACWTRPTRAMPDAARRSPGWTSARTSSRSPRRPSSSAAREDEATPVAMGLVIQEAIPDSQLVVLPASAHLATMEQPERATAAILAHLDGLRRRPRPRHGGPSGRAGRRPRRSRRRRARRRSPRPSRTSSPATPGARCGTGPASTGPRAAPSRWRC